jgi:hypothetical protein
MSKNEDKAKPVEPEFQEDRELISLRKAVEAGNFLVIYEAADWCDRRNIEPPRWLYEAHRQLANLVPSGGFPKERGRNNNIMDRFRRDNINFVRYDVVEAMKIHQEEHWAEHEDALRRSDLSKSDRAMLIRHAPRDFGKTVGEHFEHASVELRGTAAQGAPGAIRSSYYRVTKDMKDPVASWKYKLMSDRVLIKVGLEELTIPAMTRKVLPQ